MRKSAVLGAALIVLATMACSSTTSEQSVAHKLAALNGDPSTETAFQRHLDCVMESGVQGVKSEEEVADTLYASWEKSDRRDTLLEWAEALC